jgi:hypothetical protein
MPIAYLLYAIALLASYVALFGVGGLFPGFIVLGAWAFVFYRDDRPNALLALVILGIAALFFLAILMPFPGGHHGTSRRECRNNLKQIGIALHNYYDDHRSFPPAYVADENGKPMHSWRVLILPYLDLGEQELYEQYDFSQPWDSPENQKLLEHMPVVFACPSHRRRGEKSQMTSYLAVVGPEAAWPGSDSLKFSDVPDGLSRTILVMESGAPEIPWTEPRDLSSEEAAELLAAADFGSSNSHRHDSYFYEYLGGRHVLFGDGLVSFARAGTDRTLAMELLTINDDKPDPEWEWGEDGTVPRERLKLDVASRFALVAMLSLLPLPWVWLHPTGQTRSTLENQSSSGVQE